MFNLIAIACACVRVIAVLMGMASLSVFVSLPAFAGPGHDHGPGEEELEDHEHDDHDHGPAGTVMQVTLLPGLHGGFKTLSTGTPHWDLAPRLGVNLSFVPKVAGRPQFGVYGALQLAFMPSFRTDQVVRILPMPALGAALFNRKVFAAFEVEGHAAHFKRGLTWNTHVRVGPQINAGTGARATNFQVGLTYGLWPVVSEGPEPEGDEHHEEPKLVYPNGVPVAATHKPKELWAAGDYYAHGPGLWLMANLPNLTVHCRLSGGWGMRPPAIGESHGHGAGSFLGECGVEVPFSWNVH